MAVVGRHSVVVVVEVVFADKVGIDQEMVRDPVVASDLDFDIKVVVVAKVC
jgi:hypothetical protein